MIWIQVPRSIGFEPCLADQHLEFAAERCRQLDQHFGQASQAGSVHSGGRISQEPTHRWSSSLHHQEDIHLKVKRRVKI